MLAIKYSNAIKPGNININLDQLMRQTNINRDLCCLLAKKCEIHKRVK